MQTPVHRPTANELKELVHRLQHRLLFALPNQLSCRENMYPFQWPDSYAINEERNLRHVEQSESVKSDLNEKFIQFIIHPTEFVIGELNIAGLYFALKSAFNKDEINSENILIKRGKNDYEFMFLSTEEETTIHLYNYVKVIITIASQCITQLDKTENENATPSAEKQNKRKAIALENWRGLEKWLDAPQKRLDDKINAILANKYHMTSGVFWKPRELKFVDLDTCETVEF